jgi:serine/threonine-protein kinase
MISWMAQHQVDDCVVMVRGRERRGARVRVWWDGDAIARDRGFVEALVHPHVVTVHALDCDTEDAGSITVEWTDGKTLYQLMRQRGAVPPAIAARIMADLSDGLAFVRGLRDRNGDGLVALFRGLEPRNILVGVDGVTRLVDLGWNHRPRGALALQMSPFIALDRDPGEAADAWALGCALYSLLAGHLPFATDRGDFEMLCQIRDGEPPPLAPLVPASLRSLCDHALQKDPERRVASAAAFHAVVAGSTTATTAEVAELVASL